MIYLFNQTENLIDIIDEKDLVTFTHTAELNQFEQASFEIPVDYKPDMIKEAQFFGFTAKDGAFRVQRITEKHFEDTLLIDGIDRAESDLNAFVIEDKRPSGTADQALTAALEGTGYRVGNATGLPAIRKNSFYYITAREALVKIIETYGCEFRIRYTFVENKVTSRIIDLYQRMGKATGHQFEYGSNILSVTYEENSDDVVTALIGRGKGEETTDSEGNGTGNYTRRIQFRDVVWSKAKGNPVDKPAGRNYVTNEASRQAYGLHQDGTIKHRFGVWVNEEIEDPAELLQATYDELQKLSVPVTTFKASLLDMTKAIGQEIWLGDSVAVVRDQIGIAFEARVHKITIDMLNEGRSGLELGDYQTLQAKDRASRQAAIQNAVSGPLNAFEQSMEAINKAVEADLVRRDAETKEEMRIFQLEVDNRITSVQNEAEKFATNLGEEIQAKIDANGKETKAVAKELEIGMAESKKELEALKKGADIQWQESMQRYAREETVKQTTSLREEMNNQYISKATYQADVNGITERLEKLNSIGGRNYVLNSNVSIEKNKLELKMSPDFVAALNAQRTITMSVTANGSNLGGERESAFQLIMTLTNGKQITWEIRSNSPLNYNPRVSKTYSLDTGTYVSRIDACQLYFSTTVSYGLLRQPKVEMGKVRTDWAPAPEDSGEAMETKLAEYKVTVDGLKASVSSLEGNTLKKSEVKVENGRIILGSGVQVDGNTLESMFAVQPDSIRALTRRMSITGDLIVDGAITTDKLATNSITAGKIQSGAIEAKHLKADAITADALKVDNALVNKLMTGDLLANRIKALDIDAGRITTGTLNAGKVKVIGLDASAITTGTLSADRIRSGTITSANGLMNIALDSGSIDMRNGVGSWSYWINTAGIGFRNSSGKSIGGMSPTHGSDGNTHLAIGGHPGNEFVITADYARTTLLKFSGLEPKMWIPPNVMVASTESNPTEAKGISLRRYQGAAGWCTAIKSTAGDSGIEFYDNGTVQVVGKGVYRRLIGDNAK